MRRERNLQSGIVALEFLVLAPFIIGLVYAVAVYGVVFSWQIRMQIAVDRATAEVTQLPRSEVADAELRDKAVELALDALKDIAPGFASASAECSGDDAGFVSCSLSMLLEADGCAEAEPGADPIPADANLQLGFFGGFPPLPGCLVAAARVPF